MEFRWYLVVEFCKILQSSIFRWCRIFTEFQIYNRNSVKLESHQDYFDEIMDTLIAEFVEVNLLFWSNFMLGWTVTKVYYKAWSCGTEGGSWSSYRFGSQNMNILNSYSEVWLFFSMRSPRPNCVKKPVQSSKEHKKKTYMVITTSFKFCLKPV